MPTKSELRDASSQQQQQHPPPPARRASSLLSDDNESWQTPPQQQDDNEQDDEDRNLLQSTRRVLLQDADDADVPVGGWMRAYWLGLGLFLALFAFWLLDTLKDPILGQLVSGDLDRHQPPAKLLSVCTTLFLVCYLEYMSAQQEQQKKQQQQQERSTQDVMDGGGTWERMDLAVAADNHDESSSSSDDDDDDQVSSRVFLYVGLPYCVFFGIMASILQYNPRVALTDPSSYWLEEQEAATTATAMSQQQQHHATTYWHVIGYCLFAAIESFGSLIVATFWSYTNSTLSLVDAERFYGIIIALAQLGAILGSTMVTMHIWSSITLIVLACLIIVLHVIVMLLYSRRFAPTADPLATGSQSHRSIYKRSTAEPTSPVSQTQRRRRHRRRRNKFDRSSDETTTPHESILLTTMDSTVSSRASTTTATLWSGVYLILKHNYVLLILGTSCLYEVSLTCLNFQMTLLGWSRFEESDHKLSFKQFMGHYGQMVNFSSLVLSSIVFPVLIKRVGLRHTIRLFPTLLLAANIVAFLALPGNLAVLFVSLSLLKAMTYSIHDPAKEILYIPTSNAIKFKSKFWIDVVGARIAKAIGSTINRYAGSVDRSIRVASAPSLLTAGALWWVCYRVGSQFDVLVETGTTVGALDDDDGDHNDEQFCKVEHYRDLYDEDIEDFAKGPNNERGYSDDSGSIEMRNY